MRKLAALFLAELLSVASLGAAASDTPEAKGKLLYDVNCASCHGISGGGDGPMASSLKVRPPDLRLIRARNGGVFPAETVRRTIDGRTQIRSHGSRTMPVWGVAFQQEGLDADQEREVRERIAALTVYLESIQAP